MAQLKDLLVNGSARVIGSLFANLSGNVLNFGVCSTAAATAAKTVTTNGTFELITGSKILVLFSETDSSNAPTLNVNGTGAKSIKINASDGIGKGFLVAQQYYWFIYDGTNWRTAGAGITQIIPTQYGGTGNSSFTANRVIYSNTATKLASGTVTTDGSYLSNISYLSVNNDHQTGYRLYVKGTSYFTETITGDILSAWHLLAGRPSNTTNFRTYFETVANLHHDDPARTDCEVSYNRWFASNSDQTNYSPAQLNLPVVDQHVLSFGANNNVAFSRHIALDIRSNKMFLGGRVNNTWQNWSEVIVNDLEQTISGVKTFTSQPILKGGFNWPTPANITCTIGDSGNEWSIDLSPGSTTGTYWHVWSAKSGASILQCFTDNRHVIIPVHLAVGGYNNTSYGLSCNSFICDSWVRTVGSTGWYNESYGGGWYMTDSTWIRSYSSKSVYTGSGIIRSDNQLQVGDNGNKFYANSSGNGYFSNTLGIAGTNTSYKLYVNGTSYFNGTLDNQDGRLSFVQNKSIIGNTVNWNTLTTPGCYKIQMATWGDAATLHSPNEAQSNLYSFGLLFVFRGSTGDEENRVEQIYFPHQTSNDHPIYCRMHNGSSFDSGWQSWHRLARGNLAKKLTIQANGVQKGQFNNSADVTVNLGNVAQDFTGANSGNAANINADTFAGMTRQQWLNTVYPIGSIYMSVNNTSPAMLFGGSWEQLKDCFLLSAGDTYKSGDKGGEANHILSVDEMPAHSHDRGTMNITGNIWSVLSWQNNGNVTSKAGAFSWTTLANGEYINPDGWSNNNTGTRRPAELTFNAADTWTGNTSSVGSGKAHNNMPPYLTVYMWKRTA